MIAVLLACTTEGKKSGQKRSPEPPPRDLPSSPATGAAAPSSLSDWEAGRLPLGLTAGEPRSGGELVVALPFEPPSINPILHADRMAYLLAHHVYDRLVAEDPYDDPRYRLRPQLAERWSVSEDGRTYTFHLRPRVTFHDGHPLSADDVIATFEKLMDPDTRAVSMRAYFAELESVEKIDTFTVRLRWKQPYFMALDVLDDLPILPAHVLRTMTGQQFNESSTNPLLRHPLGTGPFKFVRWKSGESLLLARNEGYWGRKAYVDRVRCLFVKDSVTALQMAARQDLDLLTVPEDQWPYTDVLRKHYHRSAYFDASYSWIGWNRRRVYFADSRVRRALTLLTDRPRLAATLGRGLLKPAACHFYWASAACEGLAPLPYDPEQADRLLDEAGWRDSDADGVRDRDGVPFRFTLLLPSGADPRVRFATMLQEQFRRHGIDMSLSLLDWSIYLDKLREHEFDAYLLRWTGDSRSDPTDLWHSRSFDSGSNFVGFASAEADGLIEQARITRDEEARDRMFRRFGQLLLKEQPITFLFVHARMSLLHQRVRGARVSLGGWQLQDLWLQGERGTP